VTAARQHCIVCHEAPPAAADRDFCAACAAEIDLDMALLDGFNGGRVIGLGQGPLEAAHLRDLADLAACQEFAERNPHLLGLSEGGMVTLRGEATRSWGEGCNARCGWCGACT
jgi:hypothetical protein